MSKSMLAGAIALLVLGASVPVVAQLSEARSLDRQRELTRYEQDLRLRSTGSNQVLHLDVETEADADGIARAIQTHWSQGYDDYVEVERMSGPGGEFYCVKLMVRGEEQSGLAR